MSQERKTILVADDEASIRKLIVSALASRGFKTVEARNGLEAVQIFGTHGAIDLVITDLQMPVMDGLEAIERLRSIDPDVRVIVVSARAAEFERSGSPVRSWLSKPFSVQDLLTLVSRELDSGGPAATA